MEGSVLCIAEKDRLSVRLNRPDKMNAVDLAMICRLTEIVRDADHDTGIIVIEGNGPRAFCAGSDLKELGAGTETRQSVFDALVSLASHLSTCRVPIVASIHGYTLGSGVLIAAMADVVVASSDLRYGVPEIRHGMYPALVHAALTNRISNVVAWDLCASARLLGAQEAQNYGLVTDIVPHQDDAALAERLDFYARNAGLLNIGRRYRRTFAANDLTRRISLTSDLERSFGSHAVEPVWPL